MDPCMEKSLWVLLAFVCVAIGVIGVYMSVRLAPGFTENASAGGWIGAIPGGVGAVAGISGLCAAVDGIHKINMREEKKRNTTSNGGTQSAANYRNTVTQVQ